MRVLGLSGPPGARPEESLNTLSILKPIRLRGRERAAWRL